MVWTASRRNILQLSICAAAFGVRRQALAQPRPPLRKGLNIHHMLNWPQLDSAQAEPSYIWPPFQAEGYRTSDAEFERIRSLGFDFLRLTVDPAIFLTEDVQRQSELANIVESCVERSLSFGFSVIVDLHPVDNVPKHGPEAFIRSLDDPLVIAYGDMLWRMARLLGRMPPSRVYLELMNEPQLTRDEDLPLWQSLLEFYHHRARAGSADLPIVLSGQHWGSAQALMRLDLVPFAGSNVLVTFHYYDPHAFTHQGVVGQHAEYLVGLRWPPRAEQLLPLTKSAEAQIDANPKLDDQGKTIAFARACSTLTEYLNQGHGPAQMEREFAKVRAWAHSWGLSPDRVLLGEFGAVRVNDADVNADRLSWLKCVRSFAGNNRFPWALWVYRGMGGMALANDGPDRQIDGEVQAALDL